MNYKPTIGLEIHTELNTESKMFCFCENNPFEKEANSNVCPVCMGHPGTLPTINEEAVRKTIKTGLALNCRIAKESKFDRKNYFYPDLPKGYQISQYDMPIASSGFLKIKNKKSEIKNIRIRRIHLEEDTGKLLHTEGTNLETNLSASNEAGYSLIDFNRAGVPLMELVTEPDIESGEEARKFAEELQLILRYLAVSDADMEKGQMRVEVNISLMPLNLKKNNTNNIGDVRGNVSEYSRDLGTKVEIKNLNSFRAVEKAINFEIERQKKILEKGEKVIQETRGWHDKKEITFSQREKEEAHDYRYFPEPDLPTLYFDQKFIDEIKAEIPELPAQKRIRFIDEYGLDEKQTEIFIANKDLAEYFEKVASELKNWIKISKEKKNRKDIFRIAVNYLITDIGGLLKGDSILGEKFRITPENFAEFCLLIYQEKISSKIAKQILIEMFKTGNDPSHIIEEKDLKQISGEAELELVIKEVIDKNLKPVEDYKKGKQNALQFLVGQIMKKTGGRANPQKVQELLKKLL